MPHIAEIENQDTKVFDLAYDSSNRTEFEPEVPAFVTWLRNQKDQERKVFDVDFGGWRSR